MNYNNKCLCRGIKKEVSKLKTTQNSVEKDTRTRNWTFIIYPESAPGNWIEILNNEQIQFVVSPLHDKDLTPTGEPKKPHWHIVVIFSGVKSYDQVKTIPEKVNGTIPERVKDIRSMIRYLTHIDYPSKAQYDKNDIQLYGGVDLDIESFFLTKTDLKNIKREMFNYMVENDITEFCDLVNYAKENRPEWYDRIIESDFMLLKYIDSNRHKKKDQAEKQTHDIDTSSLVDQALRQ
ncbi:MAG: replication protein [bacterium]|nr:replication protein [bacterium]